MIDVRFFRMAAVFFLTMSVSIFAWYFTYSFTLLEKFLPMEFQAYEEFFVGEAILKDSQITGQMRLVAEARFDAAKYKKEELELVVKSASHLHSLGGLVGAFFLLLAILFFFLGVINGWRENKRVRVGI